MTFAKNIAAERPAEIALRDEENAHTWAEVDDILNRVVNGLLDLDLGSDRRIAVFAR
ncbi:MAG: hypothetical protein O7B25_03390 [Gammaproteobacteria bacterium]|nr:hypothetical protein [Gammaproteobacteria bacterium]